MWKFHHIQKKNAYNYLSVVDDSFHVDYNCVVA